MYESVEQYPHEPRVPEVYYACKEQQEWKSTRPGCLYELVARFSPAEPVDYDLIIAFLATLVWGGPGGQRPLFVITSDSGRGAGKTTFASLLTSIVGGSLQLSSQADDQIIRQRLLSPEGMEKRTTLLDNVKSLKFSWAEFEALITSEKISGKQMYVGEASRVNRITYVITINGPSLSTDLAQRAITIKLGNPFILAIGWLTLQNSSAKTKPISSPSFWNSSDSRSNRFRPILAGAIGKRPFCAGWTMPNDVRKLFEPVRPHLTPSRTNQI
jgi:hypothetical protein